MRIPQLFLGATLATAVAGTFMLAQLNPVEQQMRRSAIQLPIQGEIPSLRGARAWLNSPPLTAVDLRGKVVLIDFWTYSCINWRRTFPYLHAWAEKYRAYGLVVIGVHTPEFGFEKDLGNVRRAVSGLEIGYPIAVDSDYVIWRAFANQYWPALYVADVGGRIRHHQFGEGGYDHTERVIQQLLTESGRHNLPRELVSLDPEGVEAGADWADLKSPETYVGYERAEYFASLGDPTRDRPHVYAVPAKLTLNEWALAGQWIVGAEAAALKGASGRLVYRFHARDLNLIMGPTVPGTRVSFRARIDGGAPGTAHGIDVDQEGNGSVSEPRMYQLIRQPEPRADHLFEIEFVESGVEVFDFTFG
jgi:thiol-disulfide isomerase/thioredoxin